MGLVEQISRALCNSLRLDPDLVCEFQLRDGSTQRMPQWRNFTIAAHTSLRETQTFLEARNAAASARLLGSEARRGPF